MKNVFEIMFRWCLTYDAVYMCGLPSWSCDLDHLQFNSILYSLQDTNIVTTGGTYMISKYVSIIVVKFTMGEQQKIYNDI